MHKGRANIHARPLSVQERRRRALKGWETRRRNNPGLRNVKKTGKDTYEWTRPNGEKISLVGLSDQHVEMLGPAIHAVDTHVKPEIKLETDVVGKRMVGAQISRMVTGSMVGAETLPTKTWTPPKPGESLLFVPSAVNPESIGKKNTIVMNKYALKPKANRAPAGLFAHEIGHTVGPGQTEFINNKKNIKEFEKAFQWKAPRSSRARKDVSKWEMSKRHPHSGKKWYDLPYQGTNPIEDSAETFRKLVGVPVDVSKSSESNYQWKVEDTAERSRENYYKKHVLKQAAANNQYLDQTKSALNARRISPVRSKLLKY